MSQHMGFWYLFSQVIASLSKKAEESLHICTDLPEPSLIAYTNYDMH